METPTASKAKRSFKRPFAFPKNSVYRPLRQIHNLERSQKTPSEQPSCMYKYRYIQDQVNL